MIGLFRIQTNCFLKLRKYDLRSIFRHWRNHETTHDHLISLRLRLPFFFYLIWPFFLRLSSLLLFNFLWHWFRFLLNCPPCNRFLLLLWQLKRCLWSTYKFSIYSAFRFSFNIRNCSKSLPVCCLLLVTHGWFTNQLPSFFMSRLWQGEVFFHCCSSSLINNKKVILGWSDNLGARFFLRPSQVNLNIGL